MTGGGALAIAGRPALPTETATQIAQRQALFREVNERIKEVADRFDLTEGLLILCECAAPECQQRIELTKAEYEHLRRMPTHFVVVHGHDIPAVERVVRKYDRFVTVEKLGGSGMTASQSIRHRVVHERPGRDMDDAAGTKCVDEPPGSRGAAALPDPRP